MARIRGEAPHIAAGRRALDGERDADLADEYGVNVRTIRRWKAEALKAAGGRRGGHGGQQSGHGGHAAPPPASTPDTPRARALGRVGPVAASIRAAMASIASTLEHDSRVVAERTRLDPKRTVLDDPDHARSVAAYAKALQTLAQAAPDIAAGVGEHMDAVTAIVAEEDPAARMALMRDYAMSWGQTGTAMRAEDAIRRGAAGVGEVRVIMSREAEEALAALADD